MLTVTRLETQKKNPQRLNVYLDGEFAFGISRAAAPWLSEGDQLSQEKVQNLKRSDLLESAYQRALHYLSYRARSAQEIHHNLTQKEIPEDIIQEVLEKLRQTNLVDDRVFARTWIENRSQFKPRGKKALSVELRQKGISREIIEEELQGLDEDHLALQCARKKAPKLQHLELEAFQKKMLSYLNRRGFSYQTCREIVQEVWGETHKAS